MMDILLIEDNKELAGLIKTFLEKDGYSAVVRESGEDAIAFLKEHKVKMILLDIMLPGMDGFAFCAALRKRSNVPVLIMSARVDKEDQMNGFAQGADDYLEKPVDIDLLLAKIKALMRRNYSLRQENRLLHSGAVLIDQDAKQVFFHDKELYLTVKEYELLLLFVKNPGKTLSKEYLFDQVWGADSFSENQTLTVHVKMLRDKIEEELGKPKRIKTVWGVGYRYEEA
ncbi:MAG: response regulator transcription factor [Lachnospiraceae bacterium]|nr:response regulator transcription factor [Lachnospiraceae bacterium]MDE6186051.1 response regulator transcription factor [Lachnospiraceae bacterium]